MIFWIVCHRWIMMSFIDEWWWFSFRYVHCKVWYVPIGLNSLEDTVHHTVGALSCTALVIKWLLKIIYQRIILRRCPGQSQLPSSQYTYKTKMCENLLLTVITTLSLSLLASLSFLLFLQSLILQAASLFVA